MNDTPKPTHLGKSSVQPGMDMHAHGFRPGKPPSSIFMALPIRETDRCHVVLAGLDEVVRRFERRVARMERQRRLHLRLWSHWAIRSDDPSNRIRVASTCLGSWPETCGQDILQALSLIDGSTRVWAKRYVEHLAQDPDREAFDGDEESAAIWVDLFLEQAILAGRAGGA